MKKYWLLSIFIILSINLYAQALEEYEIELKRSLFLERNWFISYLRLRDLCEQYPDQADDLYHEYSYIEYGFTHFDNIENVFKMVKIGEIDPELEITSVEFNGSWGCIVSYPVNISYSIGDEVQIKRGRNLNSLPREFFIPDYNVFSLILSNCKERFWYGEELSTADLHGVLKISYTENWTMKTAEYFIQFGLVLDPYMYLLQYILFRDKPLEEFY